jgi:hypothetical protein
MDNNITNHDMNHSGTYKTVMIDTITNHNSVEPLLCQTLNSNGRQYNNNNMNHSSVKP